jgi:cellulose synthase/poly-beta-1,6-N-acetylglucosamine synthase-like glycosyltransferase
LNIFYAILPLTAVFVVNSLYALFRLKSSKADFDERSFDIKDFPRVSLIVCTYNEEKTIEKKWENLVSLRYPRDRLEVVFVDSSEDSTFEKIRAFSEKGLFDVKVVRQFPRKGLASALNLGYSVATGDVVIKSDSDMLFDADAVLWIVRCFSDQKVGAVTGRVEILNNCGIERAYRKIFESNRLFETVVDSTYLFNPIAAFRRELIEQIDPTSSADDAELALAIRKKGFRTVYCPQAVCYETTPESLLARLRQKSRRAQGHIRLCLKNVRLLFNIKYGRFGTFIFPMNFFMIVLEPILILLSVIFLIMSLFTNPVASSAGLVLLSSPLLSYVFKYPSILAAVTESQLALLIGYIKWVFSGPEYKWDMRATRLN